MTHTQPSGKIDRSNWDNEPMPEEIPAGQLYAGDLVPGLGIIDAVMDGPDGDVLLCAGEVALVVRFDALVTAHGAICPECDMHPGDCADYGCGADDADIYCEQCNDYH